MNERELVKVVERAVKEFQGTSSELESAIGALFVGRYMGWKVVYLIHSKSTIRKYEKILGLSLRDVCPDDTELSNKSYAWKALNKVGGFWKVVKGEKAGVRSQKIL